MFVALLIFPFGVSAIICDIAGQFSRTICNPYNCSIIRVSTFIHAFSVISPCQPVIFLGIVLLQLPAPMKWALKLKIYVVISFRFIVAHWKDLQNRDFLSPSYQEMLFLTQLNIQRRNFVFFPLAIYSLISKVAHACVTFPPHMCVIYNNPVIRHVHAILFSHTDCDPFDRGSKIIWTKYCRDFSSFLYIKFSVC